MRVAVVDYGSGNLTSASRALALAADRAGLDAEVRVTADPDYVARSDRIVLPGQGAFADCARGLAAVCGMRQAIETATTAGTPFLGICVGMQLMAERGLEHEITPGFAWIRGEIAEMPAPGLRLPQMGWNVLSLYGASKKANELMAHAYAHLFGLPATGLRFFTVYGPWGRPDMAMWLFAEAMLAGKPIKLFNYGQMRRDFTYIDDVVEAVVRLVAAESPCV